MTNLHETIASVANVPLSLDEWLTHLKRRRQLLPLLREACLAKLLAHRAAAAGLSVTDAELQAAADAFRQQNGLNTAAAANVWLAQQGWSVLDLEDALHADLLTEKFKDHLTRDRSAEHFAANQSSYARAQLRLILVAQQDLARELLLQMQEEGREFAELAREHSLHSSRAEGGRLGLLRHRQLPPEVAAAVFAAKPGAVIGPLPHPQGFQLLLIEALLPAQLDRELTLLIRQELFAAWLREQLASCKLELPLLEIL